MEARRVTPDGRTYFLLLRAHGRAGDLSGAQQVMARMARAGALPVLPGPASPLVGHPPSNTLLACLLVLHRLCEAIRQQDPPGPYRSEGIGYTSRPCLNRPHLRIGLANRLNNRVQLS